MEFSTDIISLRQLRVLYLIVQYQSVSTVAHILNISQPAVSRMLGALEKDSPYPLFDRNKSKFSPTLYAIELSEMVYPILQDVEQVTQHIYAQNKVKNTVLHLSLASNASIVFSSALKQFHRRTQGKVQVNAYFTAPKDVIAQVIKQRADLGIIAYDVPTTGEIEVKKFVESKICCVVHKNHPLAKLAYISFADLQNENIVVSSHAGSASRRAIEQGLKKVGKKTPVSYGVDTFVACDLAQKQVGVTLISELTAHTFFQNTPHIKIIPLEQDILQPFSWVLPNHTAPSNNVLTFIEEMNAVVGAVQK